jgi:signal transduction histidine kinase
MPETPDTSIAPAGRRRPVPRSLRHRHVPAWSRRRRELVVGGLALGLTGLAFAIGLTSGTLVQPVRFAFVFAFSVVSAVFAGLLWWRVRPWSPIGPLLCALGLLQGLVAFAGSANALAFSLAILLQAPVFILAFYLPASFPSGRLDTGGRLVMALITAVLLLGFVPRLLVSEQISGGAPVGCGTACPENRLLVVSDPGLAAFFGDVDRWGRVAAGVLLVALLVSRFVRASRPRRRMTLPVYVTVTCWLAVYSLFVTALTAGASAGTLERLGAGLNVARLLYPLGFIAAIVLARAYAGAALQSMVGEIGGQTTRSSLERIVRRVLDDPGARLAFWVRQDAAYVDSGDARVALPEEDPAVSVDVFRDATGEPVVALVHDSVLDEDPELVAAVGSAAALALENRRLDETLRLSNIELRESQKRLATAVAGERRRMQRDLHDGSQQHLVALRVELELARESAEDEGLSERLAEIGSGLDVALEELRSVARGIYPSLLADMGLQEALKAACRRSGIAVSLDVEPLPRYPDEVEIAVYFSCVEALQNVAKHAGRDAHAELRLWADDTDLHFRVVDDGLGFEPPPAGDGAGLTNIADRLGALGGTFSLDSAPGRGTTARGSIPIAGLARS